MKRLNLTNMKGNIPILCPSFSKLKTLNTPISFLIEMDLIRIKAKKKKKPLGCHIEGLLILCV
jgi:hypothetical protein